MTANDDAVPTQQELWAYIRSQTERICALERELLTRHSEPVMPMTAGASEQVKHEPDGPRPMSRSGLFKIAAAGAAGIAAATLASPQSAAASTSEDFFEALGPGNYGFFTFGSQITTGAGVYGNNCGVYGSSPCGSFAAVGPANGTGVFGYGPTVGVRGTTTAADGVQGESSAGGYSGVYGLNTSNSGNGVYGESRANSSLGNGTGVGGKSGNGYGVFGSTAYGGIGVRGESPFYGVFGRAGSGGTGVTGDTTDGSGVGVFGNTNHGGTGVAGNSNTGSGVAGTSGSQYGVFGTSGGSGAGVRGEAPVYGVFGRAQTGGQGVTGDTSDGSGVGVFGNTPGSGTGVVGRSGNGTGVSGSSTSGYGVNATSGNNVGMAAYSTGSHGAAAYSGGSGYGFTGGSTNSVGIRGLSTNSYGAVLSGGLAPLRLLPGTATGAPPTSGHQAGDFYVNSHGNLYFFNGTSWKLIA